MMMVMIMVMMAIVTMMVIQEGEIAIVGDGNHYDSGFTSADWG